MSYVGPPDLAQDATCGFSADLDAPRCTQRAERHLFGASPWGDVSLATCGEHVANGIDSLREVYGSHPYGPGCASGRVSVWCGDHCEVAP